TIVRGAGAVLIGLLPAARVGDPTAHGGVVAVGLPTVLIGG
ncbi:MAG: type VI secretion protein, partial [Lysobacterales bacterium]